MPIRLHARVHLTLLALAVHACAASHGPAPAGSPLDAGAPPATTSSASPDASSPIDSDSLGPAPTCELQIGSCLTDHPRALWKVLLHAENFGPGARLVALGGRAVLVVDADARFHAAWVHDERAAERFGQPYFAWAFPDAELQGIDVTERIDATSAEFGVLALACTPDRARCTLLEGQAGEATLAELPGAVLPADFEPRGLVVDRAADPPAPCAYGNGLICLFSGWEDLIAREPDLRINDVDVGDPWSLAVGSHGRYWKRERDPYGKLFGWSEEPALADVDLTEASVSAQGGVILGEGRVQAALRVQRPNFGCGTPDGLQTFFLDPYSPSEHQHALAVTDAGDVLQHLPSAAPGEFCLYQTIPAEPVLDTGTAQCGVIRNYRVLSERAVIGTNLCAIE